MYEGTWNIHMPEIHFQILKMQRIVLVIIKHGIKLQIVTQVTEICIHIFGGKN
jgi:hypothetical protein